MSNGFELIIVDVPAGPIRLLVGGREPPLLLLHGILERI